MLQKQITAISSSALSVDSAQVKSISLNYITLEAQM